MRFQIALAEPGPGHYLDYRCADVWAAGTIAYEIFSGANPFYTSAFDGRFYSEEELPRLPPAVPVAVERIVHGMLARKPEEVGGRDGRCLDLKSEGKWRTTSAIYEALCYEKVLGRYRINSDISRPRV